MPLSNSIGYAVAMRFARLKCLLIGLGLVSCAKTETLGTQGMTLVGQGVINDPKNRSLRFDLLKFGLETFCTEMKRQGVSMKLSDEHPVMGRFFATDCQSEVIDDEQRKSLMLRFVGDGYVWTNVTGRIGFNVVALVEYKTDFQVGSDDSLYVYFRPRNIQATTYQTKLVESSQTKGVMTLAKVDPDRIGRQVLAAQLERGFTVIRRDSRGETEYGLGVVALGSRPFQPFKVESDKPTLVNDRTEIHSGQQDLVGGFELTSDDQALTITASIDGAQAVDLFLVTATAGKQLLDRYTAQPGPATLGTPALLEDSINYGSTWQRTVALPKGTYQLLFDNSASLGRSSPPQYQGDDRAVKIDYVVQRGPAP